MAGHAPSFEQAAGRDDPPRRLYVYNGGFLTQGRVRRILELAGYDIRLGAPGPGDMVGVWGQSPTAPRGEAVARALNAPVLRVEDAFLRSVLPGRDGEPPLGLLLDSAGVHFDPSRPSDLERLLATHPLDDTALLNRARAAAERLRALHLSKYNAFDPDAPVPDPGYVLVVDQTAGDASVTASGAGKDRFREMLAFAQIEHPGARIVIKSHPETAAGHRAGHFTPDQAQGRISILTDPVSPWHLLEGAIAVYTVSSQLGFEAILAGHKPRVFGQPFYGGWGLTQDENPVPRRERRLTRPQLFAAAMILAPTWYDPCRDRLCPLEDAIATLESEARAWRADRRGWVASGMRLWKRQPLKRFFGAHGPVRFVDDLQRATRIGAARDQPVMVWAGKGETAPPGTHRVEDGFLRSRGLGARLVPPLSLVTDDLGIHYDPSRESRLERLITASATLPQGELDRAERLIALLRKAGVSKYNLGLGGAPLPDLPEGHRILVPGQVEDDASVVKGCGAERSNLDLLRRVRAENPDAVILYKPHPDVEAGLRPGAVAPGDVRALADLVLERTDPVALIGAVDAVWTLTSLLGFEALIRGVPVTCLGAPFYAGWGLTTDLGPVPARRRARPGLTGLAHAALIGYPRYFDPKTGRPCPAEVVVERLQTSDLPQPGPINRSLSKLQGLLASSAHLWR
ncbi:MULTISPECIES: capsular polysaccharide biosynthesis protein [Actibacterium]|uniref:Capsular polysaccharide export protein n=1 Tax=Actibacterium naphthalenivorans TaxID=1614693 RepID=A0A840CIV1_9RHOB|nr:MULTISPECIES: capsular polysaccharide biosynthesis protein [Actibacterium]ALG90998.1 capsular biosynthesis protein [Actibacterium sp. EMB200-NS6]MBB4023378.1 capsular polysaccharide export protein [Actibacterium naphthalenivorans]